jgi:hypothetical protein
MGHSGPTRGRPLRVDYSLHLNRINISEARFRQILLVDDQIRLAKHRSFDFAQDEGYSALNEEVTGSTGTTGR